MPFVILDEVIGWILAFGVVAYDIHRKILMS
jgi:hypothetical protein